MNETRVIVYGIAQQAQQLCHFITLERQGTVVAYVVDDAYKQSRCPDLDKLGEIPVINYSTMLGQFSPTEVQIANSLAFGHMIGDRERVHKQCKAEGYQMFTFISKAANVYAELVGEGSIIYPGCTIGYKVNIGEGNFLEVSTTIAHNTTIGDFNFFAPNVTLCGGVQVEHNCFVGAGAVILNSGYLEHHALVAAGTTLRNAEAEGVYFAPRATKWHGLSSEIKI